jgi:predicted dehydrogenase
MKNSVENQFQGDKGEVVLMTLDPGHFHASLVQKVMYLQIDPTVYVFGPEGPDVQDHLNRIERFNNRDNEPTKWEEKVFTGPGYFDQMILQKPGNVVILSGNNSIKTDYILNSVKAGFNVLADKPMIIFPEDFLKLEQAFEVAEEKGVMLYDIMTERHEITTILQRKLSGIHEIFGQVKYGSPENPAVTKESVHHFFKYVSGKPLKRPPWFFDTSQQGDGLVDVTTHLVDLIQWECYPEEIIKKDDIEINKSTHWPTSLNTEEFQKVTGIGEFPGYLEKDMENGKLLVYANGEIIYRIRDIWAKVKVEWNFKAPEGGGDTHYSIMKGTLSNLIIQQGKKENFRSELYIELTGDIDSEEFEKKLKEAVKLDITMEGLQVVKEDVKRWRIEIPGKYRVGHEAHFGQVTGKFLGYLVDGKLPAWEVPNMITKYYITTEALKLAREK